MSGFIYAVDAGEICKIGWSSNPHRRLSNIKTDNPAVIGLIGYVAGTIQEERALHRQLEPHRVAREWYRREGAVAEFVGTLPAPIPPVTPKPEPKNPLAKWLMANGIRRCQFAKTIGVAPSYITLLCSDASSWPSRTVAARIRKATDGSVTANSFLPQSVGRAS